MTEPKNIKPPKAQPGTPGDVKPEDSHMTGEPTTAKPATKPTVKPLDSHMTGADPR
ncbi:hypothetical protein ACIOD0_27695 [Kitasatospora albolonga]|uniref:Sigma-like protein n=1 Tax=Streptomyces stephensoniae TaxID=3375367 RepID=A0ABU2WCQ0_9ACTN|nr:hypothetical protein [Streptomyces griseus]MDT0495389.1 hypothetical protein [Streptomyces griseus]